MSWIEIAVLIFSGLAVGFINTLAGGGSVISLSIYADGIACAGG